MRQIDPRNDAMLASNDIGMMNHIYDQEYYDPNLYSQGNGPNTQEKRNNGAIRELEEFLDPNVL